MGIIDVHAHAFPDELAQRAVARLAEEANWKAYLDGRVTSLVESMDKADIDVSVVCPIATRPEHTAGILEWCKQIRSERIEPFPSVHPLTPDAAGWVARVADEGFAGIKLHPMYQDFQVDQEPALGIFRAASQAGLAVTLHCGRDVAWPETDDRAAPSRVRNALQAVPKLKLVATHMGGWRMWEQSRQMLVGQNCLLETSFSLHEMPPGQIVEMIRAHGADKVLFGTDSPWADQRAEILALRSLGLTEEELAKIFFSNAAKLLGY
jgi:hypothetical protein